MKVLFYFEKDKYQQTHDAVMSNDLLSRQSINFREAGSLGLKETGGYYLELDCSEEAAAEARKLLKGLAKELAGKEKDKILEIIQKQEDSANSGFGAIFGG